MPPSSRIPPLLQHHVHLPSKDSLILLTSTLGASSNWLLIRFLHDALNHSQTAGEEGCNVILVSWMREYEFWKQEARKGVGLDLDRLRRDGRFAFVDGLSELCLDSVDKQVTSRDNATTTAGLSGSRTPPGLSVRTPQSPSVTSPAGRAAVLRGPSIPATSAVAAAPTDTSSTNATLPGHYILKSLELAALKSTVESAVSSLASSTSLPTPSAQRRTLLILDNPDLLLALEPTISTSTLASLTLTLHALPTVSHVLMHLQADDPLLSLSTPPQPLELTHHNFLVKCAHMSRRILGVRILDTGVARDVSGVVRVTEQTEQWLDLEFDDKEDNEEGETGKEFLYQVKGDGSVRVFERGAGGDG